MLVPRQELAAGRTRRRGLGRNIQTRLLTSASAVTWHGSGNLGLDPSNTVCSLFCFGICLSASRGSTLRRQRSQGSFLPGGKGPSAVGDRGPEQWKRREGGGKLAAPCLTQRLLSESQTPDAG